ncbi:alanine--tRNA ligase [Advenella mimigardefordensis]|uniref:Alanine--tRNA ligase n=1 Tax=Advenella mimigardefordensis (strain DSM 17166 / LMG 22922 / DPN7) TaxID=1247726 RepID=W0PF59_ADVMD|nr:alanine--tRNA ligase [Advenella mimigardefordensis]AHG63925.1 alanine--tRNA ligase [Advenella mimigardefordensis DPN7]
MKVADIRQKFLHFFESKGHTIVPSSSLVPGNDPTLLFTNSGMVQFKDVFTGKETRPYSRATTSQRCLRAGGKHNDLENVGYTARHHTFFEMLGNFSFGDYFKQDAIRYGWELLTTVYGLPAEKLWVTVYQEDDEAYDIWLKEIGVPAERIIRIGDNKGARYASDNFWQMADTGPCGPCSEIFYDHGPDVWGGPPGSPEEDGDRYIEVWNLVFMQFERDQQGNMTPLPRPCVDTGMGLERIAAVLQHVHSNYEIDLFQNLIKAAARETGTSDLTNNSLKVIADHIRACSFMIVDGVIPGNVGRGYVLRRIIRRALRHGHQLGKTTPFFHQLVTDLVEQMGEAYPELAKSAEHVASVIRQEEVRFQETLVNGMRILNDELAALGKDGVLDGQTAFRLYDTFGFPFDLTADVCRERGFGVDQAGYDQAMAHQKAQAKASGKFKMAANLQYEGAQTRFEGYEHLQTSATIQALYVDGTLVDAVQEGQDAIVVLDTTPFYAESGGQVGDSGTLTGFGSAFDVVDTQKIQANVFGHHGAVSLGSLKVGDQVQALVDTDRRQATMRNHSATHLLHKALKQVLGEHVQQRGSLVDPDKTRFDFSHGAPVTATQIRDVEAIVNNEVLANNAVAARVMAFDDAVADGAMALFGEKYGDTVRVLDIGFSRELCGGTHVARTGDIGLFKIVSEGGVGEGVRRVEAITGHNAFGWVQNLNASVQQAAAILKTSPADLVERTRLQQEQLRAAEKEMDRIKAKLAAASSADLSSQAVQVKGTQLLALVVPNADPKSLRGLIDNLKNTLKSGIVLLATESDGKVSVAAGVTQDLTGKVKAGDLVSHVSAQIGGKGGGRPDMAMGGGTDTAALPGAVAGVQEWVESRL